MKEEKNDSRKVFLVFLFMLGLTVILFGATYAFFSYSKEGSKISSITSGKVTLHYQEGNGAISLTDALPMDETRGKAQTNYFEFTITSDTADYEIPYIITARKQGTDATRVPSENIRIYLTQLVNNVEVEKLYTTYDQLTDILKNNHIEQQLYTENVPVNTSNYEKVYRLRMWIDEDTDYSPTEVNGVQVYPMQDKVFAVTINVYTEVEAAPQTCNLAFQPTSQLQNPGSLTIGDEVELGTEHFYVVASDENTTTLLSKYNITIYKYATPNGSVEDLQFDYVNNDNLYTDQVPFSITNYWDDNISDYSDNPYVYDNTKNAEPYYSDASCYVSSADSYYHDVLNIPYDLDNAYEYWGYYDENTSEWQVSNVETFYRNNCTNYGQSSCSGTDLDFSSGNIVGINNKRDYLLSTTSDDYSVAYYVNRYKNKLETMNATISNARLLSLDEYNNLINNNVPISVNHYYNGPFWLGNASTDSEIYYINYDSQVSTNGYNSGSYDSHDFAGVRPVLEVPTCSINID